MLVRGSEASKKLGVCQNTLRKMANSGKIRAVWVNNKRRCDVESFYKEGKVARKSICYCRVSSAKQKDDLARQRAFLQERFPNHNIIYDVGSGLNFKRKGFITLLEQILRGEVSEVVVAHKDRLCRFGFELVQWLCSKFDTKVVVLDNNKMSPTEELTRDLLSIITIFSCRVNGLRKYSSEIKKDQAVSKQGTEAKVA